MRWRRCGTTVMNLAATPRDGSADYVRDVLQARLRVGDLTLQATEAAMLHTGARAFIAGLTRAAPAPRGLFCRNDNTFDAASHAGTEPDVCELSSIHRQKGVCDVPDKILISPAELSDLMALPATRW